jgi:hypothetical protein
MTKAPVLTEEQRKQLEELKALEAKEKQQVKKDRDELKKITNKTVKEAFPILMELNEALMNTKKKVYGMFADIIELKKAVYESSDEQYSHTFTSDCGNYRIIIGFHVNDHFEDSHTAGVDGVQRFLNSLGVDDNSKMLVDMAKQLLSRDAKGTLNAKKVMKLMQMANKSGKQDFIDNVQIIVDAYSPIKSKLYIQAKFRDDSNEWKHIPLGITEVSIDQ